MPSKTDKGTNPTNLSIEGRLTKLETQQKTIFLDLKDIKLSLEANTKAINNLTNALEREKLRVELLNEQDDRAYAIWSSIMTGLIVGVILLIVPKLSHLL